MKILCVADHIDPLVYSAGIKTRFGDVDLVLGAGDLPMEYLGFISASLNKPIFFVFGNHHLEHLSRFRKWAVNQQFSYEMETRPELVNYFGSTYIGSKVTRYRGLLIAGLGGCRRYNRGENQFTEFQVFQRMLLMAPRLIWNRMVHGRYLDILLTHAPPLGVNDRTDPTHIGFKVLHWFVARFKPTYILHGHIHLYDINENRVAMIGETKVINVYDHYVLDVAPPTQSSRREI